MNQTIGNEKVTFTLTHGEAADLGQALYEHIGNERLDGEWVPASVIRLAHLLARTDEAADWLKWELADARDREAA